MDVIELMNKWRLNRSLIARKMGISQSALSNKLSANHRDRFTETQKVKLKKVITDLMRDCEVLEV